MKQTALSWFAEKALDVITMNEFNELLSQAIKMEKEQIENAYRQGQHDNEPRETDAQEYYNQTYKSEYNV